MGGAGLGGGGGEGGQGGDLVIQIQIQIQIQVDLIRRIQSRLQTHIGVFGGDLDLGGQPPCA